MNKASIFVAYAALCVAGFAGVAAIGIAGKSSDLNAIIAFFAFYGFLCTTGLFYVIARQKVTIDALSTHIQTVHEAVHSTTEYHHELVLADIATLRREVEDRLDHEIGSELSSIWRTMDTLQDAQIEDNCCSKK
jgi:hypothetical protein